MAMTKKERELLESAVKRASINRALRWSEPKPEKDVLPPESGSGQRETRGFVAHTFEASWKVLHGLSSSVYHAVSSDEPKKTTSQRAIAMYSTRLLALKACRAEMEERFATALASVDAAIEAELDKEPT